MATYNGHKNWNHWNVALWIGNDEGLYRLALDCIRHARNKSDAARAFIDLVGVDRTPDGARYTLTTVLAALRGLE